MIRLAISGVGAIAERAHIPRSRAFLKFGSSHCKAALSKKRGASQRR
jgi:hypothetical protein